MSKKNAILNEIEIKDIRRRLRSFVQRALDYLYENDSHLISFNAPSDELEKVEMDELHHVGERSIVFRFAYYLQLLIQLDNYFKGYDLDCEYNRNGKEKKGLPRFPNGTYPDVIIHKRGSNDCNLLVLEFKTYWNKNQEKDEEKIIGFTTNKTNINRSYRYGFLYGATILIGKERNQVKEKWFIDGEEE